MEMVEFAMESLAFYEHPPPPIWLVTQVSFIECLCWEKSQIIHQECFSKVLRHSSRKLEGQDRRRTKASAKNLHFCTALYTKPRESMPNLGGGIRGVHIGVFNRDGHQYVSPPTPLFSQTCGQTDRPLLIAELCSNQSYEKSLNFTAPKRIPNGFTLEKKTTWQILDGFISHTKAPCAK